MSEPCHTNTDRKSPPPRPASVTLSPLKGDLTSSELHPNQAVVLDEVEEGEMVENKLVIPDEMVRYLNQVVDNQTEDLTALNWSEMNPSQKCLDQMIQSPGNYTQSTNVMSPASTVHPVLPSPNNMNSFVPSPSMMHSPAQPNFNQIVPSPSNNMNQMVHSPSQPPPLHPIMHSPGRNPTHENLNPLPPASMVILNQIMHSPSANMNQMSPAPAMLHSPGPNTLPSPGSNQMSQMIPSPSSNYQVMPSPSSNFGDVPMNQIPTTSHIPRVPSRCNSQMMQAGCGTNNMMPNGQMMVQNNQMVPNCYSRPTMNHSCYNMQHWDGTTCQNNMVPQQNQHNMCNPNQDFGNQCRPQAPGYNMSRQVPNQCANHMYQQCNSNGFSNCQNRPMNAYNCNTYQPMQNQGYNCLPNMMEPLPSPAMATPAPSEVMSQPQQAQMSRPCLHYVQQNCFQPQTAQYPQQQNPQHCSNCANCQNKVYQQNFVSNEMKAKMVSQSQGSPGTETTMLGMRQDTYQRTLEYVQNCQSWVNNSEGTNTSVSFVKCTDKPSSNMVVNDMTSSLSSLLEENRYLQMIQ